MLQKSLLSIAAVTLLAAMACSNKNKLPLSKSVPADGGDAKQAAANKPVADLIAGKSCLPLSEIVAQWKKQESDTFVVYVSNRDLLSGGDLTTQGSGTPFDDMKSRFEILIKGQTQPLLLEALYGTQMTSSALVGSLLSVSGPSDCQNVIFQSGRNGNVQEPFHVVGVPPASNGKAAVGTPGMLTLVSTNETRVYRMVGANLEISVNTPVPTGAAVPCGDAKAPSDLVVHVKYTIVPGDPTTVNIRPRFADLLKNSLAVLPSTFKDQVTTVMTALQGKKDAKDKTRTTTISGLPVTPNNMLIFSGEIQKQQFQDLSCK